MIENDLKSIFVGDTNFQKSLAAIIQSEFSIVPEVQFINGIKSDFCLYDNDGNINSIIECKGDDIGVTEYVRGIGQIMQYEYFKRRNVLGNIRSDCRVFLAFPSSLIESCCFDITQFSYPDKIELLIINSENKSPITIDPSKKYGNTHRELNTIQISPYYFRDTRIAELYIVLKESVKQNIQYNQDYSRNNIGEILKQYDTINKNNHRNVFISLSAIGLIDSSNIPTIKGIEYSRMDFANFCATICFEYYKPFINTIFRCFDYLQRINNSYNIVNTANASISNIIRDFYGGKDIYYLTESENRYISSWLNSLRDDLGCIMFPKSKEYKEIIINYNPLYSKEYTVKYIKDHVKIKYLENYLNNY